MPNTQGPFSRAEVQRIYDSVTTAQENISRLTIEIHRLENERHTLQEFCAAYTPFLYDSPVYRILPELWSEIFQIYQQWTSPQTMGISLDGLDTFTRKPGPRLLSQVCSSWRTIALSTPQLWTIITLNIRSQISTSKLTLVDLWLSRSGALPLSVQIINNHTLASTLPQPLDPATRRLLAESHRWESLHLITPSPTSWYLFSDIRGNVPILRRCILTWSSTEQRTQVDIPVQLFEFAPQLHSVQMQNGPLFHTMAAPFEQLTSVDLLNDPYGSIELSLDACLQVLARCPSLVECKLLCGSADPLSSEEPVDIIHTNLRTLIISGAGAEGGNINVFFNFLISPSLQTLVVKLPWMGSSGWNHGYFSNFLSRVNRLETLEIICREMSGQDAINYIRMAPHLKHLHLQLASTSREYMIQTLTNAADLWPLALHELRYAIIYNQIFNELSALVIRSGSGLYFSNDGTNTEGRLIRPTTVTVSEQSY